MDFYNKLADAFINLGVAGIAFFIALLLIVIWNAIGYLIIKILDAKYYSGEFSDFLENSASDTPCVVVALFPLAVYLLLKTIRKK